MSPQDPLDEMSVDSKSFQKSIPGFSSVPLALSAPVPSSAGLPSTRSKVKKEAKRPDRSREDDSEDEYHPAKRNRPSRGRISYKTPLKKHKAPVSKPGYFKTPYKCHECTRDGHDCYVPNMKNVGPCLHGACQIGGISRCHGHQRVNMSELTKNKPDALLRHRIRIVLKKAANDGNKMKSTGEYLEWTPFLSGSCTLTGPRNKWFQMAAKVDPTLERDIDRFLAGEELTIEEAAGYQDLPHDNAASSSTQMNDDMEVDDPLETILRNEMPEEEEELLKYLDKLTIAGKNLTSQAKVIRATAVLVKYKIDKKK